MTKVPKPSQADRWRAHREAFELDLKLRISPAEATDIIQRHEAAARSREAAQRLARITHRPLRPQPTADPPPPQWWNRD